MIGKGKEQSVIPVPTYMFEDDELIELNNRIREVDEEADEPCERAAAAVVAIKAELEWRNASFRLNDDGTIGREGK